MTFDLNDAEPQKSGELIEDGTFAKVTMVVRPGGVDGENEIDRGLLKASNTPGSNVLMLDAEFTVIEGPYARRKFWQMFTVAGGKVDEHGTPIGWKISKGIFRAMTDSALGLDPQDMSEAAKAKRILRGLSDLSGITFITKIKVEPSDDPRYSDTNKLDRVVVPGEPEWRQVMDGQIPPPARSRRARPKTVPAVTPIPAWSQSATPAPTAAAGSRGATNGPAKPAEPAAAKPATTGPAWLNG